MLRPGDTVMLPKPGQNKEHLWAIVTAADPRTGQAVIVNLTTQRPHSDTTVILQAGDHPFVNHPTAIFYADARLVKVSVIEDAIRQGFVRQHSAFPPNVLKRIQTGLLASSFTPAKIKMAFNLARQHRLA